MTANGLAKLIEECGELQQIAAKKLAYFHTDEHPDGAGSLKQRMEDEMADVMAACIFVARQFKLDATRMEQRRDRKVARFEAWHAQNSDDSLMFATTAPAQEAAPQNQGWYCATCGKGVPPEEVTYSEHHTECGGSVGDWPAQEAAPTQKSLSASVADALRPFLGTGQKVIWREPFRWHDDDGVMSNHYEMFSLQGLAADFGYTIIEDCGCAGIIAGSAK
jgi:NTP pyrophosphatase (non-canonical NTP hydrolase)